MPKLTVLSALTLLTLAACTSDTQSAPLPPPPLPARPAAPEAVVPVPEVPVVEPSLPAEPGETAEAPNPAVDGAKAKPKRGASLYDLQPETKQGKGGTPQPSAKVDVPAPAPKPAPTPAPKPSTEPEKKPTPKQSFNMPSSAHVRIDAPAGLLSDLGNDSRMQPWLSQGVSAATKCYEREAKTTPGLSGTIVVTIVMHENDRPDASLTSLPPQLSGMFACLTGSMMKTRMPLFTGKEGQKYTARVTFSP